jgi:cutinase
LGADRIAIQGVDYPALIITNILPENVDPRGVTTFRDLVTEANTRCPSSAVLAAGYSQGAAIIHAAFADGFTGSIKQQIKGVVLFGDTRRKQSNGTLVGYPSEDLLIICNDGDLVCVGVLIVTSKHTQYAERAAEGANFLVARLRDAAAA